MVWLWMVLRRSFELTPKTDARDIGFSQWRIEPNFEKSKIPTTEATIIFIVHDRDLWKNVDSGHLLLVHCCRLHSTRDRSWTIGLWNARIPVLEMEDLNV